MGPTKRSWLSVNHPTNETLRGVTTDGSYPSPRIQSKSARPHSSAYRLQNHFGDRCDHIVLHPVFGSKTVNYVHNQSSWKFVKAHINCIYPVFWVRKLNDALGVAYRVRRLGKLLWRRCVAQQARLLLYRGSHGQRQLTVTQNLRQAFLRWDTSFFEYRVRTFPGHSRCLIIYL